ncbi:MAG: hypothetical protein LBQ15_10835 [Clostridium sp.]|nr:hypothetical protein [Clostridium sp.]
MKIKKPPQAPKTPVKAFLLAGHSDIGIKEKGSISNFAQGINGNKIHYFAGWGSGSFRFWILPSGIRR